MGRERCDGCGRAASVCLCSWLPSPAIRCTRSRVVVLQHPHEARHKLSTLPILARCLDSSSLQVVEGRAFRQGSSALLDSCLAQQPHRHALLLYPSDSAQPLISWLQQHSSSGCLPCRCQLHPDTAQGSSEVDRSDQIKTNLGSDSQQHILIIAIDATWQHASEMVKASAPFLSRFCIPVCLPYDVREDGLCIGSSDLILRKEPFKGCMTTMEAVACCLRLLEPNGLHIHRKLLSVLRTMVQFQVSNVTAHKIRSLQSKKNANAKSTPSQNNAVVQGGELEGIVGEV